MNYSAPGQKEEPELSNHNYSQYSNKNQNNQPRNNFQQTNNPVKPVEKTEAKFEQPINEAPKPVIETVVEQSKPEVKVEAPKPEVPATVIGMVVGCAKLNVREEANLFSDVVCVLNAQSEMEIDISKSNKDWFFITTATGIEGYCMRKFVEANL